MPPPDDHAARLRADAERVLADPPLCRCGKDGCRFQAAVRVARAYLALAAGGAGDDGEPVTEEWMYATGLPVIVGTGFILSATACIMNSRQGWSLYARTYFDEGDEADPVFVARLATRGHVRRLCHALRIPLALAAGGAGLPDEEYGRAWAGQQGVSPAAESGQTRHCWYSERGPESARVAVVVLEALIRDRDWILADWKGQVGYRTESAAYAALGRAVRAVHAAVPPLGLPLTPGAAT